ncbi:elongin-B isoform X1 [Carassius gibelio]|uniref:elongin-B isoform X1 n=1 Tax=Carassius gibelio TaxID=101364 RepID=UPI002277D176|nr:elongin-B isoform X1 [Carassius gibelio]
MDVFLMIRHRKTTIFTDAKESTTVYELKCIVEGILKRSAEEQRLYKDEQPLEDSKTLGDCGFTNQTARPQAPATVGLAFRISGPPQNEERTGGKKNHTSKKVKFKNTPTDCVTAMHQWQLKGV